MAAAIAHLKRRGEFLKVAGGGRKYVAPGLILQVLRRNAAATAADGAMTTAIATPEMRFGLTASRKVGIAVIRNRARRRLRAAAIAVLPACAASGHDYVLIARAGTASRRYAALLGDLTTALRRLGVYRGEGRGALEQAAPHEKVAGPCSP